MFSVSKLEHLLSITSMCMALITIYVAYVFRIRCIVIKIEHASAFRQNEHNGMQPTV